MRKLEFRDHDGKRELQHAGRRVSAVMVPVVLGASLLFAQDSSAQTCPPSIAYSEAGKTLAIRYESSVKGIRDFSKLRRDAGAGMDEHMEVATVFTVNRRGKVGVDKIFSLCGTKGNQCRSQPRLPWGPGDVDDIVFPEGSRPGTSCVITPSVTIPVIDASSARVRESDAVAASNEPHGTNPAPASQNQTGKSAPAPSKSTQSKAAPIRGDAVPPGFAIVQGRTVPVLPDGRINLSVQEGPMRTLKEIESHVTQASEMVLDKNGFISHFASKEEVDEIRRNSRNLKAAEPRAEHAGPGARYDPATGHEAHGTPDSMQTTCNRGIGFKVSGFTWMTWMVYIKSVQPALDVLQAKLSGAPELFIRLRLYPGGAMASLDSWAEADGQRIRAKLNIAREIGLQDTLDQHALNYVGGECELVFAVPLRSGLKYRAFANNAALR